MNRRDLLRLAGLSALTIAVPRFGAWYRRGSGVIVREVEIGPLWGGGGAVTDSGIPWLVGVDEDSFPWLGQGHAITYEFRTAP